MADAKSLRANPIGQGNSQKGVCACDSPGLQNTSARTTPDHDMPTNVLTKETSTHKPFGELGGQGMGGAE